jgi:general nucleoside transport system permease protein
MTAISAHGPVAAPQRMRWRLRRLPGIDRRRRAAAYAVSLIVWIAIVATGLHVAGFPVAEIADKAVRVTLTSSYGLQQTLTLAAPLILTGAAVAVTMRINIWNVGGDGQFYAGALAATAVGLFVDGPPWLMLGLMGLVAAAAGAAWMVVPAVGRAYAGISEIITTLLLSFVASYLVAWLSAGPWRDPLVPTQAATARIPYELPALNDGAHLGIVVAVMVVALLGVFLNYSKWGYELVVIGANPDVATYAGFPVRRRMIAVMLLSGLLAGLAGMIELAGVVYRLQGGMSNQYGALGIPIAAVAGGSLTGVVIVAGLFAVLLNIGVSLQTQGLSVHSVLAITGLLLLIVAMAEAAVRFTLHRVAAS